MALCGFISGCADEWKGREVSLPSPWDCMRFGVDYAKVISSTFSAVMAMKPWPTMTLSAMVTLS